MERYRAVVTWKKLRPYYPDAHVEKSLKDAAGPYGYARGNPTRLDEIKAYYDEDKREVGEVFETVFDNQGDFYRSARSAKQAVSYHTKNHPFASIYGDGNDSTEILSVVIQKAEMVVEWKDIP